MIGRRLSRYTILERVGAGAMGEVYLAEDSELQRRVAVKVIAPRLAADPAALARFKREARAVAALNHPHIVTIHSVEEDGGVHFMTMEYVEGEVLSQAIPEGGLPLPRLLDLAIPLFDAIEAAHRQGVTHRDLKPGNIMITRDGRLKVLDFGLSKLLEPEAGSALHRAETRTMTEPGVILGTTAYMSPEQAEGRVVDARSDLFSLGVVLFEMATGKRPFSGQSAISLLSSILKDPPPSLSAYRRDLPDGLGRIVERCLAKSPDERFQSAAEVRDQLQGLKAGAATRFRSGGARRRLWGGGLAVLALAIAAGTYFAAKQGTPPAGTPPASADSTFVVAIMPFWGATAEALAEGKVMQTLIEQQIRERVGEEEGIKILGKELLETPRSPEEAQAFGERLGATAVVWGEVLVLRGEVDIRPSITMTAAGTEDEGPLGVSALAPGTVERGESPRALEARLDSPDQLRLRKQKAEETSNLALLLAAGYYERRASDRALELLRRIDPPSSRSRVIEASIARARGERERALALLFEAIAMDSTRAEPHVELGDLYRHEDPSAALLEYERAIALEPTSTDAHRSIAILHYEQNRDGLSIKEFRTAIQLDPKCAACYHWLGHALARERDFAGAEDAFRKACALVPNSSRHHVCFGDTYLAADRPDEALAQYDAALRVDPSISTPHEGKGAAFRRLGRYEDAIAAYETAIDLDPEEAGPRHGLAVTHLVAGHFSESVEAARAAADIDPEEERAQLVYVLSLLRAGDARAARERAAAAVGSHPGDDWRTEILRYLAGEFDEAAVWAAIRDSIPRVEAERRGEALLYLGLAHGFGLPGVAADPERMASDLEQCLAIQESPPFAHDIAQAELARLQQAD